MDDLKITVATNKQLLEDFCETNSKLERQIKIYAAQITLMTNKLRENNIDFNEQLELPAIDKKFSRSNTPSAEAPSSTLTTERITKNIVDDKVSSLSGGNRDKMIKGKRKLRKVVKRRSKRDGSTISSNSSNMITSYRTAQVGKQTLKTSSVTPKKPNLDLEKCGLSEENKFDETEEPISFRDNHVDENEQNMNLDCDSDSISNNDQKETKDFQLDQESPPHKIKIKKLSKNYNKHSISQMFNHIERELLYNKTFHHQDILYLEDDNDRIWEIKQNELLHPNSLPTLSSLKTLDSPLSLSHEDLPIPSAVKNQTTIVNFSKLRIEVCDEEGLEGDGTEESRDGIEEKSLVIDYESMEEFCENGEKFGIKSLSLCSEESPRGQVECNFLELY